MGVTVPSERERLKAEYLDAFAAANPEARLPRLGFYGGWWQFAPTLGTIQRVRTTKLQQMTETLRRRVQL